MKLEFQNRIIHFNDIFGFYEHVEFSFDSNSNFNDVFELIKKEPDYQWNYNNTKNTDIKIHGPFMIDKITASDYINVSIEIFKSNLIELIWCNLEDSDTKETINSLKEFEIIVSREFEVLNSEKLNIYKLVLNEKSNPNKVGYLNPFSYFIGALGINYERRKVLLFKLALIKQTTHNNI